MRFLFPLVLILFVNTFLSAQVVRVEGESFLRESGGAVIVVSDRPGTSGGKAFRAWDLAGHQLEWTVEIPAGEYVLLLRVASGRKWDVFRGIQVDGRYPGPAWEAVKLPPTGGFGTKAEQWQSFHLADSQGQPALIPLTAGSHSVTLINLGGGAEADGASNLDYFEFIPVPSSGSFLAGSTPLQPAKPPVLAPLMSKAAEVAPVSILLPRPPVIRLAPEISARPDLPVPPGNPGLREADGRPHPTPAPYAARKTVVVPQRAAELGFPLDLTDSAADDQPGIKAVLLDPELTEDTVLVFPAGVYNLTGGWPGDPNTHLRLMKNRLNLVGEGPEKTIFRSTLDDKGKATMTGLKVIGVSDVVLRGFSLTTTWNRAFSTQTEGNSPDAGGLTYGIAVGAHPSLPTFNVVIENVLVEKFRRMAFRVDKGSHDVVLRNCVARNATDVGDGGHGYGFVLQGAGHKTAAVNPSLGSPALDNFFNVIEGCRTEGPYIRHSVIVQYWAHHNLIVGNTFEDTQLDSIDLHGEDEYANEVARNVVYRSQRAGIALGNSGAGHDRTGVDNWIHDNEMVSCLWGMSVQYGTVRSILERNLIRGNASLTTSSDKGPCGIFLGSSADSTLRNNRFEDNTVPGFAAVLLVDDRKEGEEPAGGPVRWEIAGNSAVNSGEPFVNRSALGGENRIQEKW